MCVDVCGCVWMCEEEEMGKRLFTGSSARRLLTVSILFDESQRGISASLCVQRSGWSVFIQSSHTRQITMLSNSGRPRLSFSSNILPVTQYAVN